jgi:hypothetical protein
MLCGRGSSHTSNIASAIVDADCNVVNYPTYVISFCEKIEQTNASTTINFTSNVILIIKSSKLLYKISKNKIIDSKPKSTMCNHSFNQQNNPKKTKLT